MRLANGAALAAGVTCFALFLLASPNEAFAQQVPAYVATVNTSTALENWSGTAQGTSSSCPNPSDDGSYGPGTHTASNLHYGPVVDYSAIKLIEQGGNWIPASSAVANLPAGFQGTVNSTLNSSGTVTTTANTTFTNASFGLATGSGTLTVNETLQLVNGTNATWTSTYVYTENYTDTQNGCLTAETGTINITGTAALQLQPYAPQASITLELVR